MNTSADPLRLFLPALTAHFQQKDAIMYIKSYTRKGQDMSSGVFTNLDDARRYLFEAMKFDVMFDIDLLVLNIPTLKASSTGKIH